MIRTTVRSLDKTVPYQAPSALAGGEPSLRERKIQRTRQTIIDEASRLFLENGYSSTTLKDIAEAAETSIATIMRYFGSKEEILLHRERAVVSEIAERVRSDAFPKLSDALRDVTWTSLLNLPERARLFDIITTDPECLPIQAAMRSMWDTVLTDLFLRFSPPTREGQLRAQSLAAMMTASGVVHMKFWHQDGMRRDLLGIQQDLIDEFITAFVKPIEESYAARLEAMPG